MNSSISLPLSVDGVIFDLDGTLWDATESLTVCWAQVLGDIPEVTHIPTLEEMQSVMGMTPAQLVQKLFPYLTPDHGLQVFHLCCQAENEYLSQHGGKLYPGVGRVFDQIPKKAIVSNCDNGYIEAFFTAHGLSCDSWLCHGDTGLDKWENIKLMVQRQGYKHPVYLGDTRQDMQEAQRAGVPFIHAAYGFGQVDAQVPAISNIENLLDIIDFI